MENQHVGACIDWEWYEYTQLSNNKLMVEMIIKWLSFVYIIVGCRTGCWKNIVGSNRQERLNLN